MCWKKFSLIGFMLALVLAAAGCSRNINPFAEFPDAPPGSAVVHLNASQQVIRGFGGVNMPGWIPDMTADQVQTAFGADSGQIGMTILRIRVPYDSSKFDLEVPAARLAKSLGAILIASPWTPPAWMKSSNNIVGGSLKEACYAAYAAHLKSFADYMSYQGAPLYAVSIQNEPDVSVTYESCDWNASQMLKFVKENGPSIGVRIILPESYNFSRAISDAILRDADAASKVAIIGGHIYGGGIASYPLAASKGKEVWMTEHLVVDTDWLGGLMTAKEIHDCMNAGMNAYLWWYIRRFYGPMDDDGNVTKRGYFMSQYARFIRPGFTKVNATANPQTNVYVTAYKSGTKVVIVAINYFPPVVDQTFVIRDGTVAGFTPYVTSEIKNCAREAVIPVVSDGSFTATLDAESVTTFVSD
jgi:glucuronoarabinoxylan endo-1,4-beta-xylanase